ncbi:MAG: BRO-N domain-containing protein [Bacteroidales bacterium]
MNLKGRRFENEKLDMEIFVYDIDGKEMFIGNDISKMLGYSNYAKSLQDHVWKQNKKSVYVKTIENTGNTPKQGSLTVVSNNKLMITEVGLYQLVFKSKMSKAIEFQDWVCGEVLPSIRKNRMYAEQDITRDQVESYMKENEALRNVIQNYSCGLAQSKDLEKYLKARFPDVKDSFVQVMNIFVSTGILDKEWKTTDKFRKYNSKEAIIKEISVTTDTKKTKFVLTNAGLKRFAKNLTIENGKIIMKKFNI